MSKTRKLAKAGAANEISGRVTALGASNGGGLQFVLAVKKSGERRITIRTENAVEMVAMTSLLSLGYLSGKKLAVTFNGASQDAAVSAIRIGGKAKPAAPEKSRRRVAT